MPACVPLASTTRSDAQKAEPDLDEVLGALQTLVGHPAWAVMPAQDPPMTTEPLPEGYLRGRTFSAILWEPGSIVAGAVYLFAEPKQASDAIAAARTRLKAQIDGFRELEAWFEQSVHPAGAGGGSANHPRPEAERRKAPGKKPRAAASCVAAGRLATTPGISATRPFPGDFGSSSWIRLGDGAGSANALPGLHLVFPAMNTNMQLFSLGRVVVSLTVTNAQRLDRAAQDEAIDYAAAFLRDPAAARKRAHVVPRDFGGSGGVLRVQVEGPDGVPMPRALAVVGMAKRGGGSQWYRIPIHAGAGVLPLPQKGTVQVLVVGAAGADGEPLRLRPAGPFAVDAGQPEIAVRLEGPGPTIAGRILVAEGETAHGIRVEALFDVGDSARVPAGPGIRANPLHDLSDVLPEPYTSTRSSEDGSFELVGLLEGSYRLRFLRGDAPATQAEPVVAAGSTAIEIDLRPPPTIRRVEGN